MGILLSAYQKYYSALSNLNKFRMENDFFDNISYLDAFFSEYRNITFVLQKSISKDEKLKAIYQRLREKYLTNEVSKWMLEKRNETIKEQPFQLEKHLAISVYLPNSTLALPIKSFTVENDTPFKTLKESLQAFFLSLRFVEVHFSVEYSFYEKGSEINIISHIFDGIKMMDALLCEFNAEINEPCELCDKLTEKISRLHISHLPIEMLFTIDYLYHIPTEEFTQGGYSAILMPPMEQRASVKHFKSLFGPTGQHKNTFYQFILFHITCFQQQKSIMPTFMLIYDDNTFIFDSCEFSIRTTLYRKVNNISKRIKPDGIGEVYYVAESYHYETDKYKENMLLPYDDRVKHSKKECLSFYSVSSNNNIRVLHFDSDKIDNMEYVIPIMRNYESLCECDIVTSFLKPIMSEYESLRIENNN